MTGLVDPDSSKTLSEQDKKKEIRNLKIASTCVVAWLVLVIVASLAFVIALLAHVLSFGQALLPILLCVSAGTLGSAISALISVADRTSHGWELSDGTKHPKDNPKDRFVGRMVPLFIVRPFLGSAMGFVVYAGLFSGYLIAIENAKDAMFSPEALAFLSGLAGLFAKTFFEKLRSTFDELFGKSAAQSGQQDG